MNNQFTQLADKFLGLENKRGIVTGGSTGIGKAIALTLSKAGATVYVFSRSGKFKTATEQAGIIHHIQADVTKVDECKRHIAKIGEKGLDFLVNNAGISIKKKMEDVSYREWQKIQDVNVNAAMNFSQIAFPFLKKSKSPGRIINIASMASVFGFNEVIPYTVSKSALAGLTRGLSVEWASENILVNSVSPGWIKTTLLENVVDPEREKKILNRIALHRYGEPVDIANMVWYLVSPASKYITGQNFFVDGGALVFGY